MDPLLASPAGCSARPALKAGGEAVPVRLPVVLELLMLVLILRFFPRAAAPALLAQLRRHYALAHRRAPWSRAADLLDPDSIATALRACRRRSRRLRALLGWVLRGLPARGMAAPACRPHGRIPAALPVRPARAPPCA